MTFENYELEELVKCKLNKFEIEKSDLEEIKEISINSKTITGKNITNSFNDLINFKNLEKLAIFGFEIDKENIKVINYLKNIKNIELYNCILINKVYLEVEKIKLNNVKHIENIVLKKVKSIEMNDINMNNFDYSILKNVEDIILDDVIGFNETSINLFKKCKSICFKNMELMTLQNLIKLKNLEKISLLSCKLYDKSYINNLKNINVNIAFDYLLDSELGEKYEN